MKNLPVEPGTSEPVSSADESSRIPEVIRVFLRLGFTAFGGPAAHIAMMRDEMVERRQWVSPERFVDLLGVANLIPGPSSTELAIYLGYVRAGLPGLFLGGICFIAPAMLIVLVIAWAYVTYGSLPQVGWLFYGIQPVIVAIILQAIWNLSRTILKGNWVYYAAGAVIVALYLLGINILLLLFGAGVLIGLSRWAARRESARRSVKGLIPFAPVGLLPAGLSIAVAPVSLGTLFLTFLKFGAVIYGSGYVLLAFVRTDLVQNLGWLTDRQLLDAVTVGQFTPGPLFTSATFIGYLLGGLPGALLATLGIFLPSFFLIFLIHPIASRLRQFALTSALLDGVNIAALGLMTGVLLQLAQNALVDPITVLISITAFAILLRFKINSVWLILAGAAAGIIHGLLTGVISL